MTINMKKQVDKSHYQFENYMAKERWCSVWHQLDEVIKLKPESVLEIGPGPGVFKAVAKVFGIKVESLDLDPDLNPDYVGSATSLPFADNSYDVVCAFQMLEHLPYDLSVRAFAEMARISRRHVVISLPDSREGWRFLVHIPKTRTYEFFVPFFQLTRHMGNVNKEHYWEVNKKGYPLSKIIKDYSRFMHLLRHYSVSENQYHRFFIFKR